MGGAKAGEFASRIAVEKITTLLPRAFQQSASGLNAGFSDVLAELFAQIHRALVYLGGSYEEMRRDADDDEPVLVHAGLDVFRPHRRQPDLPSAEAEKRQSGSSRRTTRTSAGFFATEKSANTRRARIRAATCCKRRSAAATSLWIRRSARSAASAAIFFCSARTA